MKTRIYCLHTHKAVVISSQNDSFLDEARAEIKVFLKKNIYRIMNVFLFFKLVFWLFIWHEWLRWETLDSRLGLEIQHSSQKINQRIQWSNKGKADHFKIHHETLNITLYQVTTWLFNIATSGFYLLGLWMWTEKKISSKLANNYYTYKRLILVKMI